MKLYLTSIAMSAELVSHFTGLVGKSPAETHIVLIENAADVESGDLHWVRENYQSIVDGGFNVGRLDLRQYADRQADLATELEACDVIWLGGGNIYYLRDLLKRTGADEVIRRLIKSGTVYAGGSAGAVVAGPTLKHFEAADDPSKAPADTTSGLGLTDIVLVPHIDNAKHHDVLEATNRRLLQDGFRTCPLRDGQALVIDGDSVTVIP
jgi:dipeptidase E